MTPLATQPMRLVPHTRFSDRLAAVPPITQHGQSRGFRASGISGCLRTTGYRLLGHDAADVRDPNWDIAAAMGSTAHLHLQRQLVLAGMCVHLPGHQVPPDLRAILPAEWHDASLEVPLTGHTHPDSESWRQAIGYAGHVDAVLRLLDGRLACFDLKTVAAKYMVPTYRYHADKLSHYVPQVRSYLALFAMPDGEQARVAFVLMLNRDDPADRLLYQLDFDADGWAVDRARLDAAYAAVAARELPTPEPERGCRFCAFSNACEGYRP